MHIDFTVYDCVCMRRGGEGRESELRWKSQIDGDSLSFCLTKAVEFECICCGNITPTLHMHISD